MMEILKKRHSGTQLAQTICRWTWLRAHLPVQTHTEMLRVSKGLLTSLWPSHSFELHFLRFALNTDSYREPCSALQGAAPQRATISLLVNKPVSYNPSSPPLCLDCPAQLRRGCFVREGEECQTTWASLQSAERVREGSRTLLPELISTSDHIAW